MQTKNMSAIKIISLGTRTKHSW